MTHSCYVYYRVRAERTSEAETQVRTIMRDIGANRPINARLARKVGEPLLWMEVYDGIDGDPAAFVAALDALVARHGLQRLMPDGEHRHVEVFECV